MKKIRLSASGKGRPSKNKEPIYSLVDDADYEWLNQWNWTAILTKRKNGGYASRNECGTVVLMHRLIMDARDGEEVDHEDGHGLNNQRHNLRKATRTQQLTNRPAFKNNKSGYKGVSWYPVTKRWKMDVSATYDTPEEAARAYDRCANLLFGEFARLNFPVNQHE